MVVGPQFSNHAADASNEIPEGNLARWRDMIGMLHEVADVTVRLVWRISVDDAEVMISAGTASVDEQCRVKTPAAAALFNRADADGALSTQQTHSSRRWIESDERTGRTAAYLGLPILWLEGRLFGVIELLDTKARSFTPIQRRLADHIRTTIEEHLGNISTADGRDLERERLVLANQVMGQGVWDYDIAANRLVCDEGWYNIVGLDRSVELKSIEDFKPFIHPDDVERATNVDIVTLRELRFGDKDYSIVFRIIRPSGEVRWLRSAACLIEDDAGLPTRAVGVVVDVSESHLAEEQLRLSRLALRQAEASLDDERQRLLMTAEASGIGSWEFNLDSGVLYCDPNLSAILGMAPDTITDMGAFYGYVHPDDFHLVDASQLEQRTQERENHHLQFRVVRPSGEVRWVSSTARMVEASGAAPNRFIGFVLDITESKQAAEALRSAKEAAEAAELAKGEFLATMSHEIRTPMNTVIGMTCLTLQTELTSKQRNYLEKIDASAKNLLSIINDVLDFSKIEAGRLELEDTEFTLESVLDAVSTVTSLRAEEKGIEIAYSVAASVPRSLQGDPLRLSQVLINLVGNAIKFTDAGEVIVSVKRLVRDDHGPMLEFRVRDTGIGLSAEQISGLFRPFSQADQRTSRSYGGTGLGLAICKKLVEQMGGEISLDSTPGRGSTFSFTIDLHDASTQAHAANVTNILANRRVMIVDDNSAARQILTEIVVGFGMTALSVSSGAEALALLARASQEAKPFDLVMMDWRMPGMDGLEVARRIRANHSLSLMPAVLMVTAYAREDVMRRVDQLGLQGLVVKPVTESMIFNVMQSIFGAPMANAAVSSLETGVLKDLRGVLAGRRVLVVDDSALNREVATDFLELADVVVDTAANGAEALLCLAQQRYDAVLMDMHMPGMDGLEATRRIRRNPAWANLPVVALTAQARSEDRDASVLAGMTGHLTKPIDEVQLYRSLAEIFASNAARKAAPFGSVDFDAALNGLRGDNDRLVRLLKGFVREFEGAPAKLRAIAELADDLTATASLAHLIQGAAGYLHAQKLVHSAARLEAAATSKDRFNLPGLANECHGELQRALDAVSGHLTKVAVMPAAGRSNDTASILALIAAAEPLIARGDDAASVLLERLTALLNGRSEGSMVDAVQRHYQDTQLADALACLARLRASLSADRRDVA